MSQEPGDVPESPAPISEKPLSGATPSQPSDRETPGSAEVGAPTEAEPRPVSAGIPPSVAELSDDGEELGDDVDAAEVPGATELFLRVNSVIPDGQELKSIEPGRPCSEALQLLADGGFSQAPIVRGRHVIGLFSYRSFSAAAAALRGGTPGDIPVEDAMTEPVWVRATDELGPLMEIFDARDAVLVGDEDDLQAIVTGMDVLRHLDALSEPFVRLRGIELALRQLVDAAVDAGTLAELATAALGQDYADRRGEPPQTTKEMTLGDLTAVVLYGPSWRHMKSTLGANRNSAVTHLTDLSKLRNTVLHFHRELDKDELARIRTTSEWLRTRMRAAGLAEGQR